MAGFKKPTGVTKRPSGRAPPIPRLVQSQPFNAHLKSLLEEHRQTQHLRARVKQSGVSLQEIERFDLTSLYGAHDDTLQQLLPPLPPGSLRRSPSTRQASIGPPYNFQDGHGDENTQAVNLATPLPPHQEENPPAAPSLIVRLRLPQGHLLPATAPPPLAAPPAPSPAPSTAKRPADPPGIPTNAVYAMGTGPIPPQVQAIVDEVNKRAAMKKNRAGFPLRVDLRSLPAGMMGFDRRYGHITQNSALYGFYGDLRLFNEATWKYLVGWGRAE